MNRLSHLTFPGLLVLVACSGGEAIDNHVPNPNNPTTPTNPTDDKPKVGPMPRGVVPTLEGFDSETFALDASSPVVAVTPDGRKHHAMIDAATGWPAIGRGFDEMVALPSARGGVVASKISMVASADGMLHAVWVTNDHLEYAEIDPVGYQTAPRTLARGPFAEPTMAIGPDGEVIVAVRRNDEHPDRRVKYTIAVMEITGGRTSDLITINGDCCVDQNEQPAEAMSGASLAVGPDGMVHVVYEWMTFGQTTIEYVVGRGSNWTSPLTIADAAFAPCPAIAVDDAGAHITYLLEGNRNVWYVRVADSEATEPVSLYASDAFIGMALMTQDAAGVMHVLVEERQPSETALLYVRSDALDAAPLTAALSGRSPAARLTPQAGGAAISSNGELYFSTLSPEGRGGAGRADVVFGRRPGQD